MFIALFKNECEVHLYIKKRVHKRQSVHQSVKLKFDYVIASWLFETFCLTG